MPRSAGQQPVGRGARHGVVLDLGGEHAPVVDVRPKRIDLVDDQTRGERGGDRRVRDELSAEHPAERPDSAEPRERPQRPAAVAGGNPGQPQHHQRQQDGQYDRAEDRPELDQLRLRTTDQRAQRLDPVPELTRVSKRVVRPVVEREHLVVDDLQTTTSARTSPPLTARMRRGVRGRTAARATRTRPSSGIVKNPLSVRSFGS